MKLFIRLDASRSEEYRADTNNSPALDTTPTVSPNLRHKAKASPEPANADSGGVLLISQRDATVSTSAAMLASSDREATVLSSDEVSLSGAENQSLLELSEHSPTDHEEEDKLTSKEHSL